MLLVLCDSSDAAALWAYRNLKARGLTPIELVSSEVLLRALMWEHRLGVDGISTRISLSNNRTITSDSLRGVLNRLTHIDSQLLAPASPAERSYAMQEMTALGMSWLTALQCPVLNLPEAQGLSGSWRHPSEWTHLAARAGLPTTTYRQNSSQAADETRPSPATGFGSHVHTIFVVEGSLVHCSNATLPAPVADACRLLSTLVSVNLLGIELSADGSWTFANATPQPDLRLGGGGLLDALSTVWREL